MTATAAPAATGAAVPAGIATSELDRVRAAAVPGGAGPNLFLVGAMKAGTTALAALLDRHPEVAVSTIKEPCFFCPDVNARPRGTGFAPDVVDPRDYRRGSGRTAHIAAVERAEDYLGLFAGAEGRAYRADCSTPYLYSEAAAGLIAAACPGARVVISLREPAARAFSEYLQDRRIGRAARPFRAELEAELAAMAPPSHGVGLYVRAGFYADQVARFLAAFPRERVTLLAFEAFARDPEAGARELFGALGLGPPPPAGAEGGDRRNAAGAARLGGLNRLLLRSGLKGIVTRLVPGSVKELGKRFYYREAAGERMDPADRAFLREVFRPDVLRLEALTGLPLAALWGYRDGDGDGGRPDGIAAEAG